MDEVVLKTIGHFTIYKNEVYSMGIFVEENERGNGFARRMMNVMLEEWCERGDYDPSRTLYIDADASGGFWDHIGMVPNPDLDDKSVPQYGYEKCITVASLDNYLNFRSL